MEPSTRCFRFTLLGITCFMTLGSYYCLDMPTGIQAKLQGDTICPRNATGPNDTDCCSSCLGLTPEQYNALFAIRAWVAAISVALSGLFIDKVGNRVAGILFSCGIVIGSALFAVASMHPVKHTPYMFPTMVIGRFILGLTESPTRIVQDRITAYWFSGQELSTAFGITLTASRCGSVISFFVTPTLAERFGISAALWMGALLCVVGLLSTMVVTSMDAWGIRRRKIEEIESQHFIQKQQNICWKLKEFSAEFWLILVTMLFFYSSFMPFIADSSKFIEDMYDISDLYKSSYISGAAYDISLVVSPFLGYFVDRFGGRAVLSVLVGLILAPCYILLVFTVINPVVITLVMGLTYTATAVAVWSSLALLVPMDVMGLALGLATSTQGLGVGVTSLIVGAILGDTDNLPSHEKTLRWRYYLLPLFINAILSSLAAFIAVILDRNRGNKLSHTMHSRPTINITCNEDQSEPDLVINTAVVWDNAVNENEYKQLIEHDMLSNQRPVEM